MDEQHLADLAALARLIRDAGGTWEERRAVLDAVPALVAEVTRLREKAGAEELHTIPLFRLVAERQMRKYAELEMLAARAAIEYGIDDPTELVVCEEVRDGTHRLWVEVQSPKAKDERLARAYEEVAALREQIRHQAAAWGAEVTRLEGEVARLRAVEVAARTLANCDLQRCRASVWDAQRELWAALDAYWGSMDWGEAVDALRAGEGAGANE